MQMARIWVCNFSLKCKWNAFELNNLKQNIGTVVFLPKKLLSIGVWVHNVCLDVAFQLKRRVCVKWSVVFVCVGEMAPIQWSRIHWWVDDSPAHGEDRIVDAQLGQKETTLIWASGWKLSLLGWVLCVLWFLCVCVCVMRFLLNAICSFLVCRLDRWTGYRWIDGWVYAQAQVNLDVRDSWWAWSEQRDGSLLCAQQLPCLFLFLSVFFAFFQALRC